jgi:formylglycine-generating enzyme required for sulfatase activity
MRRGRFLVAVVAPGAALLLSSCGAPPAQLLIIVDTDAPLSAQLLSDPSISADAVIDTVRIDRIERTDDAWHPVCLDDVDCTANFVLPDPSVWPFSFGVATPTSGATTIHLRIRAFRGAAATRGTGLVGLRSFATIDPPTEATIDRLIDIDLPSSGEETVRIHLSADCLGEPASLRKVLHTCLDGSSKMAAPTDGVVAGHLAAVGLTRAGTWARSRERACGAAPAGVDAVCIRGGFSYLGEAALAGVEQGTYVPSTPQRPIYVDSFFMDRTELTVGRFRALVNDGLITAKMGDPSLPDPAKSALVECRWLGAANGANDEYPMNCLSWDVASSACKASHGDLPTEAQWEHAARGRGQGLIHPWGNESPLCCTAALCTGEPGPAKVGSHRPSDACGGPADVSRDGVLDLGGNVAEFCADTLVAYGEGYWSRAGIFVNPLCNDASTTNRAVRGGDWSDGLASSRSAFRSGSLQNSAHGFRCVYPGVAP